MADLFTTASDSVQKFVTDAIQEVLYFTKNGGSIISLDTTNLSQSDLIETKKILVELLPHCSVTETINSMTGWPFIVVDWA